MMRRFGSNASALEQTNSYHGVRRGSRGRPVGRTAAVAIAALLGASSMVASTRAEAQEIQLTGPLAGAPAVRNLRLHRKQRFEVTPTVSFTLLDQYQRTIMPGLRATYHLTDWFGIGLWGAGGFQSNTGLTDELQAKGVDGRACASNPALKACRLTAVNLTRGGTNKDGSQRTGLLSSDQMGHIGWVVAPQAQFVPFRGKVALFSSVFVDTDVNLFVGPAFVGLQERKACGFDENNVNLNNPCEKSFQLESRVAIAPTFGLGLNFYPQPFLGVGLEWRGLPFAWNTSGFDNHGGGKDQAFPDNSVNAKDREFHFNSMLTVNLAVQFPTAIKSSE